MGLLVKKSLRIDNKLRTIYFVGCQTLTFSDDNEPRELIFQGPPRNVFVEGFPHPFYLGFDGRAVEFETEGKWNIMRFGSPFREIYINNHPYEAQFGGPHFTAVLADNKAHRIQLDGPPPRVIMSATPAYDLYKTYKSLLLQHPVHDKSTEQRPFESAIQAQDVDMRLKDNILQYPPTSVEPTPESMKDVDWRQIT
ncbi:Polyadenylation and cleavage factor-like protein 11, partial [Stegodyphus mimosarum]